MIVCNSWKVLFAGIERKCLSKVLLLCRKIYKVLMAAFPAGSVA